MGAVSLSSELKPGVVAVNRELHQELASAILAKCRELVEEYMALARSAPAEFPFAEIDLLRWYCEMKLRINGVGNVPHGKPRLVSRKGNSRRRAA